MPTRKKDLSRTEWRLMNICWEHGKASARDIYEETLKEKRRTYQAVKTMLDRLVGKGYLKREKFGPIWLYEPSAPRKTVVGHELDTFVSTVLDNTFTPLLAYMVKRENISPEELAELRKFVEEHSDDEGKGGR